jgi:hypothetical protein
VQYRTVPLLWNTRVLVIGTRDAASCLMGLEQPFSCHGYFHTVLELHHNTSRHYYRYVAPAENIERSLLIEFCGLLLVPVYLVAYFNARVLVHMGKAFMMLRL